MKRLAMMAITPLLALSLAAQANECEVYVNPNVSVVTNMVQRTTARLNSSEVFSALRNKGYTISNKYFAPYRFDAAVNCTSSFFGNSCTTGVKLTNQVDSYTEDTASSTAYSMGSRHVGIVDTIKYLKSCDDL